MMPNVFVRGHRDARRGGQVDRGAGAVGDISTLTALVLSSSSAIAIDLCGALIPQMKKGTKRS